METIKSTPPECLTVEQMIEQNLPNIDVFYDGQPLKNCIAYSVPEKWVDRYKVDEHGRFYVEDMQIATERLTGGEVRVEWRRS